MHVQCKIIWQYRHKRCQNVSYMLSNVKIFETQQICILINNTCYSNETYKLKCQCCDKLYTGQTDEILKIR